MYRYYVAFNHGNGQQAGSGWTIFELDKKPTSHADFMAMHRHLEKNGAANPTIMFFTLITEEDKTKADQQ